MAQVHMLDIECFTFLNRPSPQLHALPHFCIGRACTRAHCRILHKRGMAQEHTLTVAQTFMCTTPHQAGVRHARSTAWRRCTCWTSSASRS